MNYKGVPRSFGRGSAIWSEATDSTIFCASEGREAPPIELRLGQGAQPGLGDEAPGKFSGFYVNFRHGEGL